MRCYHAGCTALAVYKVASRWSDGATEELKTYALACAECLPALFHAARQRQTACRRAPGEVLDEPSIFLRQTGHRDRQLVRQPHLEARLRAAVNQSESLS